MKIFCAVLISALWLSACGTATPTAKPATETPPPATAAPTTTPAPTATPAPQLGSKEKPLQLSLLPATTAQELLNGGELIAKQLSELTGYTIQTHMPVSYTGLSEALKAGNVHIAVMPPAAYTLAHQRASAEIALTATRNNAELYAIQYIAHADAKLILGKDAKDVEVLKQFMNKKPCWTDLNSIDGYVIPLGFLKKQGIKVRDGAFLQGHAMVVKAVYFSYRGDLCDFGATLDDARSGVLKDFPDALTRVVVVYKSAPLIPYNNISYAKSLPAEMRDKLSDAFLKLALTNDGKTTLRLVYQIEGLKKVDDSFYDTFRTYIEASGVDLSTLVK